MSRVESTDMQITYLVNNLWSILLDGELEDVRVVWRETTTEVERNADHRVLNGDSPVSFVNNWCPHGDSNSGLSLERATS